MQAITQMLAACLGTINGMRLPVLIPELKLAALGWHLLECCCLGVPAQADHACALQAA